MKIIIAVHHFPPHRTAGAEMQALRTATGLQAQGHEVEVICVESIDSPPNPYNGSALSWQDDLYMGIPVRRLAFNLAAAPDPERWEYDNPLVGDHLSQYLAERTPDLFHLFSGYLMTARAIVVAKELGIPTIVTLTDFWFLCRRIILLRKDGSLSTLPIDPAVCARCLGEERALPRYLGQLAPALMQSYWRLRDDKIRAVAERMKFCLEALNSADLIIALSKFIQNVHIEAGISVDKTVFCRQGFPEFMTSLTHKQAPTSKMLRIGYLGQINHHKGVHILIEAITQMAGANVQLTLYGDLERFPSYTKKLRQMAKHDPRIHFAGLVAPEQLGVSLQAVDVLVVPSIWYENSPNTIAEAFAHHVPVIASNLGGMAELVHHEENGLLFEAGNPDDLARQLQRLLDEPHLLAQLQAGIQAVKSVAEEIDELEAMYTKLHHSRAHIASHVVT